MEFISWIWCRNAVTSEWIKSGSSKSIRFSSSAAASNAKQAKRNMFNEADVIVIVNTGFGAHCTIYQGRTYVPGFTYQFSFYQFYVAEIHYEHTRRLAMFLNRQGIRLCLSKKLDFSKEPNLFK